MNEIRAPSRRRHVRQATDDLVDALFDGPVAESTRAVIGHKSGARRRYHNLHRRDARGHRAHDIREAAPVFLREAAVTQPFSVQSGQHATHDVLRGQTRRDVGAADDQTDAITAMGWLADEP